MFVRMARKLAKLALYCEWLISIDRARKGKERLFSFYASFVEQGGENPFYRQGRREIRKGETVVLSRNPLPGWSSSVRDDFSTAHTGWKEGLTGQNYFCPILRLYEELIFRIYYFLFYFFNK